MGVPRSEQDHDLKRGACLLMNRRALRLAALAILVVLSWAPLEGASAGDDRSTAVALQKLLVDARRSFEKGDHPRTIALCDQILALDGRNSAAMKLRSEAERAKQDAIDSQRTRDRNVAAGKYFKRFFIGESEEREAQRGLRVGLQPEYRRLELFGGIQTPGHGVMGRALLAYYYTPIRIVASIGIGGTNNGFDVTEALEVSSRWTFIVGGTVEFIWAFTLIPSLTLNLVAAFDWQLVSLGEYKKKSTGSKATDEVKLSVRNYAYSMGAQLEYHITNRQALSPLVIAPVVSTTVVRYDEPEAYVVNDLRGIAVGLRYAFRLW